MRKALQGTTPEVDSFDVFVGRKVKEARIGAGESQTKLAARWGISFQQVQKYEKGANRLSFRRVFDLARFYDVPLTYFIDGVDDPDAAHVDVASPINDGFLPNRKSLRMLQIYNALPDEALREAVVAFMMSIIEKSPGNKG